MKASTFILQSARRLRELTYSQAISPLSGDEELREVYRRSSSRRLGEMWISERGAVMCRGRVARRAGTRRGSLGIDVGSQNASSTVSFLARLGGDDALLGMFRVVHVFRISVMTSGTGLQSNTTILGRCFVIASLIYLMVSSNTDHPEQSVPRLRSSSQRSPCPQHQPPDPHPYPGPYYRPQC